MKRRSHYNLLVTSWSMAGPDQFGGSKRRAPAPMLGLVLILLLTALACGPAVIVEVTTTPPPTTPPEATAVPLPATPPTTNDPLTITIEDLQAATVQILAKQLISGRLRTAWTGSGTIVSPDGLILTNAHVASPGAPGLATLYNDVNLLFSDEADQLVIALSEVADRPPVELYIAEIVALDGPLDLAVVRITADINGRPVNPTSLNLPYADLGDSNSVRLGDQIRVLGYPGAGGETITFTRGNVSGFESQPLVGDRAWIKTDTAVSPGNSGGLGVNEAGQLIGVPSFVQEAMGGAINRLRAINFARPMIEAAAAGRPYSSPYVIAGSGRQQLRHVTWTDDYYEETNCPVNQRQSFAAGSTFIASVFEYSGMTDGEQMLEVWWLDDQMLTTFITNWNQGERGSCTVFYIHNFGDPLPNGNYLLEVYVDNDLRLIGAAETVVGGAGTAVSGRPGSGVMVQGEVLASDSGRPVGGAAVFFLQPGVNLESWLDDPIEAAVFAYAETDKQGQFQLPQPLERGQRYPGVVYAAGYRILDGYLEITSDDPETIFLTLELTR
jgi:serine protease Do